MGEVYNILKRERDKKGISNCKEMIFFHKFKGILKSNPIFFKYLEIDNDFDIIKANIIIKSIINKDELDNIINDMYVANANLSVESIKDDIKERISDLPYIAYDNFKIYVPFFNKATNIIYSNESEKMFQYPYVELYKKFEPFFIDPFETYNIDLYSSLFTQLVKILESDTAVAFYHYDFNAIFIINRQGTLDNIIYLFDKHMKNPHKYNIIEKVRPLVEAYFNNDLSLFIYLLYKNDLVSYYVFRKICKIYQV